MEKDRMRAALNCGVAVAKDNGGGSIERSLRSVSDQASLVIERLENVIQRAGGSAEPGLEPAVDGRGLLGQALQIDNMMARVGFLLTEIEQHV